MHIIVESFLVCDFSKMALNMLTCDLGRILKSQSYESDLAVYGKRFEDNKQELKLRLTVRTNLKLNQVTDMLAVMMLFNLVRSPKEKELMELIDKEGGASKVIQNPALLEKIIKESEKNRKERGAHQNDEDDKRLVSLIQAEIRDDLQKLIKSNEVTFELKFDAQKEELTNIIEESVERTGDRVIEAVTSGPYERLKDPHLFEIWKEMVEFFLCSHKTADVQCRYHSIRVGGEMPKPVTWFLLCVTIIIPATNSPLRRPDRYCLQSQSKVIQGGLLISPGSP